MTTRREYLKIAKAFLKSKRTALALYSLTIFVFGLIFLFGRLPFNFYFYSVEVSAFIGGIFGLFSFMRYADRYRYLQELYQQPQSMLNKLEKPSDPAETFYQETIRQLLKERQKQALKNESKEADQLDYFTLWLHQIKTPIAAIQLVLQQSTDKKLTRQLEQELLRIENYTRMALSYLKLEQSGKDLDLAKVSLDQVIKKTIKTFSILFIYNQITLDYQENHLDVLTDEQWLRVLLEQLLSNSLKYTPPKGQIKIYLDPKQTKRLIIEDTGIGIRSEDLPRIFEKGYSGWNGKVQEKSTGLGLFLSQKISKRLGHPLSITSEVGKGTKVAIDLDVKEIKFF